MAVSHYHPVLFSLRGWSLAIAVLLVLTCSAVTVASPGRTLVVRNNTNATLIFGMGGGDVIPPNTERSYFNRLKRGRNVLNFFASCVNNNPFAQKAVWVSGAETRVQVVELFPRDFDKTQMFDGPGCSCLAILGQWKWFNGITVQINDNASFTASDGNSGTWSCTDLNTVRLNWKNGGWKDEVRVSPDGNSLAGKNQHGGGIGATRIAGSGNGDAPPPKQGCGDGGYNPYGCPK